MDKLNLPDWMRDCEECMKYVTALEGALGEFPLREFESVRKHLAEAHLGLLPGYFKDCANCQEWQALDADAFPAGISPILAQEALLHRAGHLLT